MSFYSIKKLNMRKKTFSLTMIGLFSFLFVNAQVYEPGKSYVSAGYGIGNFVQSVLKTYETYDDFSSKIMGPIFCKYEYAINEQIGFGVTFAYVSANASYRDNSVIVSTNPTTVYYEENIDWNSYSFLMRFNWHFNSMGDRLDPYIGFGLGYRGASWKFTDNDPSYSNNISISSYFPLGMELTAGMRFMFTDFLGIYSEVGFAKAVAQFGIIAKF